MKLLQCLYDGAMVECELVEVVPWRIRVEFLIEAECHLQFSEWREVWKGKEEISAWMDDA